LNTSEVVVAIARKEVTDRLRNRWVWTVSALLFLCTVVIALFGAAPVGVVGGKGAGAVMASLMNLVAYLVPLIALILGCGAIIDEKQRGTLDLILVYPLSPRAYFAGTFLGFALALALAVVVGLVLSGLFLVLWVGVPAIEYLILTLLALALGAAFLALSFLVSLLSRERGRAIASSVFLWIFAVFVFDLILVGILVASGGKLPATLFGALLLANPSDCFRLLCFQWLPSAAAPLGLAAVAPAGLPAWLLLAILTLWVAVPAAASYALFQYRVDRDALV